MGKQESQTDLESLIDLKQWLYTAEAAAAAAAASASFNAPFDREAFTAFLTDNPAFKYIHLFATDDDS